MLNMIRQEILTENFDKSKSINITGCSSRANFYDQSDSGSEL